IGAACGAIAAIIRLIKQTSTNQQVVNSISDLAMTPLHYIGWIGVGLVIIGIILFCLSTLRSPIMGQRSQISGDNVTVHVPETFTATDVANNETVNQITYQNIGYGPLIDASKVKLWLSDTDIVWKDSNGKPLTISASRFRSIYGFIPPSFQYFPQGQDTNDYNSNN